MAVAAASNKIESAQDIQTWFTGYGLDYGPYAADGFMGSGNYTHFDGILAMYHDQGGVYKLVAVKKPDGSYTPKMKCSDSASKAIIPGKKMPWRLYDENGQAQCDLIAMDDEVIEAGKPITMVNLDSDAIERTVTITPTKVKKLLVPHILNGQLAIELPSIAEKKAYIAKQLTEETWESELRLECPHKHYVNMTPAVAECRSKMYAELHGGKV